MFLFAATISVSFTLGDIAAPWIEPTALTALRFIIAAIVVGAVSAPLMQRQHFRHAWRYLVVGGLLAGYFILMFEALRITDPVSSSAVFTLTPIMSAIAGYLLLRQVTTVKTAGALLIAGVGAIWVIFRADIDAILDLRFQAGERLFFIGCAMHALYTPMGRKLNNGEPLAVYTFGCICGGLIITLVYGAGSIAATDWLTLPPIAWAAALYLGIGATAGTVFLVQYATLRLPSAKVMAYGYLVPAFVILWEGLIGHGWVQLLVIPGVIGILAALLLLCLTPEAET